VPDLSLTDEELRDAAQAARLAAWRAQKDTDTQPHPRINAAFAADAERYKRLSAKFDAACAAPRRQMAWIEKNANGAQGQ
jgi:hypothetical protein